MVVLKCFTGFKHINSNYVNTVEKMQHNELHICNICSFYCCHVHVFSFSPHPVCALCHFSYGEETS